ncbi:aliphatic sulfonate ABC transporter permease SsuC [Pseudanabaena yagii]|uniref:Aliphatic sulfonate ABC transporter permease SsuC n=1 Tax=Pseudanabaena yagii GIHE-NHR1 TaxID=2722753 RepID=A0ABX1LWU7_9CYAN|nr:aliphatic sulfonate ABC transporter permease SsuC [Pseudanabaena yagii]NMF60668.1 aliphatic sulfonate ABC transporter permease SsuC [Pseudanabaena yagii GIHE-NHR1]
MQHPSSTSISYHRSKNNLFSRTIAQLQNGFSGLVPWLFPIFLVILWQLAVQFGWLSTRILPAPTTVISAAIKLAQSGELATNFKISASRALTGFAIGGSIGFIFGLVNGLFRVSEKIFDTTLQMWRNIPNLALIPLVILWFGIGEEAKLFLVSSGVLFPIYINTFHGIRSIDSGLIEMGKVYGLNPFELFWNIILPGALPSILVGVRFSLGIMWLSLIVAETIAADSGIGYMATSAREFMQTDVVVFSILLYASFGKLADVIVRTLEAVCLNWHPNYQKVKAA